MEFMRKQIRRKELIKKNIPLILMSLPALVVLIMFNYVPMFGLTLAFEDYNYADGIFKSPKVGLQNFKYIFASGDIARTIGNTVAYHVAQTILILVVSVALAVLLFFVRSKRVSRIYQKNIIVPYLLSYVIISYIVNIFLNSEYGLVNRMLEHFGKEAVSWYTTPVYWPFILVGIQIWFGAGIKSIYYYGALMNIDEALFEAADLDGASHWFKIRKIMLPALAPTICIFLILDLGKILESAFGLFYSVPMDSSALYSVTDVLSTYTYRGLMSADIGTTTALGLFTGVVTTVATLLVNAVVKKVDPESSLL